MEGDNEVLKENSKAGKSFKQKPPSADAVSNDETGWEVEKIRGCMLKERPVRFDYLVDWKGTDSKGRPWDPSWEPVSALDCKQKLNEFRAQQNGHQKLPEATKLDLIVDFGEHTKGHIVDVVEKKKGVICIFMNPVSTREFKRRKKQNIIALNRWEDELNESIAAQGREYGRLYVQNSEDFAGPPSDFVYVTDYVAGEPSIVIGQQAVIGCECKDGVCGPKSQCCPITAGDHAFAYTEDRKVKVKPGNPIYECNSMCKCDDSCINRVVQKGSQYDFVIFRTRRAERGWGLRTIKPISKGEFVMEYVGEVVTSAEAARRGNNYDEKGLTYLFDMDFNRESADDPFVYTVDANNKGNMARFINHSCDPNLHLYSVWIENLNPDMPRLAFFAARDIAEKEELTFDYYMRTVDAQDAFDAIAQPVDASLILESSDSEDELREGTCKKPRRKRIKPTDAIPELNNRLRCLCKSRKCRKVLYEKKGQN